MTKFYKLAGLEYSTVLFQFIKDVSSLYQTLFSKCAIFNKQFFFRVGTDFMYFIFVDVGAKSKMFNSYLVCSIFQYRLAYMLQLMTWVVYSTKTAVVPETRHKKAN